MRIAYLTESLPPLVDGVSHTLGYLRKSLESNNIDYTFYSPFCPENDAWSGRVNQVLSVPFPLYRKYRVSLPGFHDLRNSLDRFEPDLIHICSPIILGLFGLRYARERNVPVVNSFHTRFVSYLKYYGFGWLERFGWSYLQWFYNRGDRCFAPSEATIRELRSRGFENVELWSRGIDLNRFSPKFADRGLRFRWSPDGKPIALYVGRLVKEKDIDILLKAHSILNSRGTEYRLVFVGDGPMRRQIENEASDAILAGHLDGEDLSRAYASSDIFVFPSTTESFGNVVLEATASGLPAMGSAEGGIGELIQHEKTGFLVTSGDFRDYADKLEALIEDKSLRDSMAASAMEFASRKNWDLINGELFNKYERLIAVGAGRGAIVNEKRTRTVHSGY
jgi:glycosyltransferase involved in cell wall biosynthesis